MNTPKHTPGPWKVINPATRKNINNTPQIIAMKGMVPLASIPNASRVVANLHNGPFAKIREEINANARLIAAAPDLLDALKKIATGCPPSSGEEEVIWSEVARNIAEAAIAKAERRNIQ
jgi:hypothetical protein